MSKWKWPATAVWVQVGPRAPSTSMPVVCLRAQHAGMRLPIETRFRATIANPLSPGIVPMLAAPARRI
jgi:hypothetical protein